MQEFIGRLGREGYWNVEIKIYWAGKDAGIYRQTGERGVLECRNKNILGGKDAGIYRQTGEKGLLLTDSSSL